jgi:hypothetical protein
VQVLAAHRILSAPVVVADNGGEAQGDAAAAAAGADKAPEVSGFIDIRDLLSSFLQGEPGWAWGLDGCVIRGLVGGWVGSQPARPCGCPLPSSPPIHSPLLLLLLPCSRHHCHPCAEVDLKALADAKMLKRMRILEEQVRRVRWVQGSTCTHARSAHKLHSTAHLHSAVNMLGRAAAQSSSLAAVQLAGLTSAVERGAARHIPAQY